MLGPDEEPGEEGGPPPSRLEQGDQDPEQTGGGVRAKAGGQGWRPECGHGRVRGPEPRRRRRPGPARAVPRRG